MAKKKLVLNFRPFRVESGGDVGISPMIDYALVEPDASDAGYDVFDAHMLAFVKEHFITPNESGFSFTIVPHGIKQWSRVFAESKRGK
jgi:hypothetical protein